LGVALAIFAVVTGVIVPMLRRVSFVLTSPRLAGRRPRAVAAAGGVVVAVAGLLLLAPAPLFVVAEGVIWPPEDAHVRASADGFVLRVLVEPDAYVAKGTPLFLTRDATLETRVAVLEAKKRELRARYHGERAIDLVRALITREELTAVEAELSQARDRVGEVLIRSPADGFFVAPRAADRVGHFVRQGTLLGYVVGSHVSIARVVLPEADAALVRRKLQGVELRLASRRGQVLDGRIGREQPAAIDRLPSRALGTSGGGRLLVDPADPDGLRPLEPTFQLDVQLPSQARFREIGQRVYVRFDLGAEPVAQRAARAVRSVFLRQLGV
jgi:putative peptide zinc metalloprotease protein